VASDGPLLIALMVKTRGCPTRGLAEAWRFVIARSAEAFTVVESVWGWVVFG